jgi:hypothetical protein
MKCLLPWMITFQNNVKANFLLHSNSSEISILVNTQISVFLFNFTHIIENPIIKDFSVIG